MIKANGEIKLIAERKMSVMEMTLILYCDVPVAADIGLPPK